MQVTACPTSAQSQQTGVCLGEWSPCAAGRAPSQSPPSQDPPCTTTAPNVNQGCSKEVVCGMYHQIQHDKVVTCHVSSHSPTSPIRHFSKHGKTPIGLHLQHGIHLLLPAAERRVGAKWAVVVHQEVEGLDLSKVQVDVAVMWHHQHFIRQASTGPKVGYGLQNICPD